MDIIEILTLIIVPAITTVVGYIVYNERDKINMKLKTHVLLDSDEAEKLIDYKIEGHKIEIRELKSDVEEIKVKLDKIIDILSSRK